MKQDALTSPASIPTPIEQPVLPDRRSTLWRIFRYLLLRVVGLGLTAVAGMYLTLFVANLGGKVDDIRRAQIAEGMAMGMRANTPEMQALTTEERAALLEQRIAAAQEAAGLNQPLLLRNFRYLTDALTFNFGDSRYFRTIDPYHPNRSLISALIKERIPPTLLLFGLSNLLVFVMSIWLALIVARRYGGWLDKLIVMLSPLSIAPSWFYAIFLIAIFAGGLAWFPFGGMRPPIPPDTTLGYLQGLARHTFLPFMAVFLSAFFQSVYAWRTFFLIYASEDYVEMAKAKGVSAGAIGRRYILRPTLPPILTSLALVMISVWSGSVILESLFNWPGLGELFFLAITRNDNAVVIALTAVYAYFLAFTILLLDISYALVDPRVRVGAGGNGPHKGRVATAQKQGWAFWRPRNGTDSRLTTAQQFTFSPWSIFTTLGSLGQMLWAGWRQLVAAFREIIRYPSAVIGLGILLLLAAAAIYTIVAVPYEQASVQWRGNAGWSDNPANARPAWFNYFSNTKRPLNIFINSQDGEIEKTVTPLPGMDEQLFTLTFVYPYDDFPQDIAIQFFVQTPGRSPHIALSWLTPDGRTINLGQHSPNDQDILYLDRDTRLIRRLGGVSPKQGLLADPEQEVLVPLKGEYQLQVSALLFEEESNVDARLMVYGQLHGLGGTDYRRRDLGVALLWGIPTALALGIPAAIITTLGMMVFAGVGVWFGGPMDGLIQRLNDMNLVIPLFPILAMITQFYTISIWYVLVAAAIFGIFGSGIKTYRAIFLQVKESPYVEAAQAYGAGNFRIIFFYLVPRIIPVLIPQIVALVPSYVFLEAALAFVGLSDPTLPTWGKIINDAHSQSALLNGHYYWILQPTALLLLLSLAFALVGFALDRIFNPRLKEV